VQDQYHDHFGVYEDVSSADDHFFDYAKIGDLNAVSIDGSVTTNPHAGATAIRNEFRNTTGTNFGGFYFLNGILPSGATAPQDNFGTVPNAGITALRNATALTFWARGERGGEKIEFFMGGVGRDPNTGAPTNQFPDSTPRQPALGTPSLHTLSTSWQMYTIPLAGVDLSYVLGGFAWVANALNNPQGAVFYLDDIRYELSPAAQDARLNEPHFLRSYTTLPQQAAPDPVGQFDLQQRNSAYSYDNALALLAFLADGSADGARRARLIGDAFVYAAQHDRTFTDGRLRSDYAAGDIALPPGWTPNGLSATVPVPGYFIEGQGFTETGQQGISTGDNAWAMLGLLRLYQRTGQSAYLDTARRVGEFIRTFRSDTGTYKGFQGGLDNPESATPIRRPWQSTEHNLDVYAAFTLMARLTGESSWSVDADLAHNFVEAMWDAGRGCYLTGTTDPDHLNQTLLPLDVQAWSVLALPGTLAAHPAVLACAERNQRTSADGFSGYDFNDDKDGVWFEGTGQMATAYAFAGQPAMAEKIRQELRQAQQASFGDGNGLVAASHDGLTTGLDFLYFRRLHVGATAWNVFAQREFNPYGQAFLRFAAPTTATAEDAGQAVLTVCLTGGSVVPVTVQYATRDGTAVAGADYTAATNTLTFAPGEVSKTFAVTILPDALVEGDESFNVDLSNPLGGPPLAAPSTAVVTIADRPPAPQPGQFAFEAATYSVADNTGMVTITVKRSGGSDGTVSVDYDTSDAMTSAGPDCANMAVAGVNYKPAHGTLTFLQGETSKTFMVAILHNPAAEDYKTVTLTLSHAVGAPLGSPATAVLTILDSDLPVVADSPYTNAIFNAATTGFAHSREHFIDFVATTYRRLLMREPDPAGLNFWVSGMQAGVYTDEQVEAKFLVSGEYEAAHGGTGRDWVIGMYQDLLGRPPTVGEIQLWLGVLAGGTSPETVAFDFASSREREEQRVRFNYETYLCRQARQDEVDLWVGALLTGTTNEAMFGGFLGSREYYASLVKGQGNKARWVSHAYQDVLGRPPSAQEITTFWLPVL
jgi:hypothetical protein